MNNDSRLKLLGIGGNWVNEHFGQCFFAIGINLLSEVLCLTGLVGQGLSVLCL